MLSKWTIELNQDWGFAPQDQWERLTGLYKDWLVCWTVRSGLGGNGSEGMEGVMGAGVVVGHGKDECWCWGLGPRSRQAVTWTTTWMLKFLRLTAGRVRP